MLRGWDEGFTIPSLWIAVDSTYQGKGIVELLMRFLHVASKLRGAPKIRLKVYPENTAAVGLYRKLGYRFMPDLDQHQYVAYLELD